MTPLLFFICVSCITLLPILIHRQSQGHATPTPIMILAAILFLLTPIIALYMIFQYLVVSLITALLGVFL